MEYNGYVFNSTIFGSENGLMYPQFMAIWMVYKPTFKVGYIDIYIATAQQITH